MYVCVYIYIYTSLFRNFRGGPETRVTRWPGWALLSALHLLSTKYTWVFGRGASVSPFRVTRGQFERFWGLWPTSQRHSLALTVLYMPYSLDRDGDHTRCGRRGCSPVSNYVIIKWCWKVKFLTKLSAYCLLVRIKTRSWQFCGGVCFLKPVN